MRGTKSMYIDCIAGKKNGRLRSKHKIALILRSLAYAWHHQSPVASGLCANPKATTDRARHPALMMAHPRPTTARQCN